MEIKNINITMINSVGELEDSYWSPTESYKWESGGSWRKDLLVCQSRDPNKFIISV